MRIRPALLFWGLFFILLGGLPLLVRAGVIDPNALSDAWRLWPLLLVALGVSLILGRSRAGLLGTAVAAIVLGVAAGGALASGTSWIGNVGGCGVPDSGGAERFEDTGTVDQPISANFDLDCGTIDLSIAPGSEWRVQADYEGEPPTLELSNDELGLRSPGGFGPRRQQWTVTLPADAVRSIDLSTNAGSSDIRLAGADLAEVTVDLNAGDVRVDATEARIERVDLATNAGRIRLRVDENITGSLAANAGSLELCAPQDATLRLRVEEQLTFAHNLDDRGLARSGDVWTREGAVGAPVIDLSVEGNAANFTLDPEGGC
jgi:LiaI-LiaF-like transmembrane region/Toastrack DUF4097